MTNGPKRRIHNTCMNRFNYEMPEWLEEMADTALEVSTAGSFLGTLCDVAEICEAGGGMLRKRSPECDDFSVARLRGLIRYVSNQMVFMRSRSDEQWAAIDVAPNQIVIHSEWLIDVAEAARTLSYNIGQFGGFPTPIVFETADDFRRDLDEQARFAVTFHRRILDDMAEAERAADQPTAPVADSNS